MLKKYLKRLQKLCQENFNTEIYFLYFLFYNINQWTERKNPLATIKAYWTAFQKDENVGLVLKTYGSNYSAPERDAIKSTIKRMILARQWQLC